MRFPTPRCVPTLCLGLAALLLLPWASAAADPATPTIPTHDLRVQIEPSTHRLIGEDTIHLGSDEVRRSTYHLAPSLELISVTVDGKAVDLPKREAVGSFMVPGVGSTVTIRYAGTIHQGVKKEEDLSWVRGDGTNGIISEEGVYLSPAAGWYPMTEQHRLAKINVTALVPAPWLTVTQGSVPERTTVKGEDGTTWNQAISLAGIPTDGIALVAGKFVTKSHEVDGVTVSTFFYEQDAALQDLWLDEAVATVKRYTPILGKYPHDKFDIVTNFFQTGYGMPGWTLLGDRVIRYVSAKAQRTGKIPPGYLDHEYVHGWFGNGLFVDYATGNWCEAITTYFSNYLAKELESPEAGLEHRRGVLEKFAIRVHGKADYPLREFRNKLEDSDNDVGYGKGSMLFHMIRRQVGDEVFFQTVKDFTQSRLGTVVTWDEWLDAFSATSAMDVTAHVGPWLEQAGLPDVALAGHAVRPRDDGTFEVDVEVRMGGDGAWPVFAPIEVVLENGDIAEEELELTGELTKTTFTIQNTPVTIRLDSGYDLLRRISGADIPQCLNRTLESQHGTVAVVNGEKVFDGLSQRIAGATGWDRAVNVETVKGRAVILEITEGASMDVGGQTWTGDDIAVMRTTVVDGNPQTRYTAFSAGAAARAGYATYYGWDTWVVFRGGRPVARGIERGAGENTIRLAESAAEREAKATAERATTWVHTLCQPPMRGRGVGTGASTEARKWIRDQLHEGGILTAPGFAPSSEQPAGRFPIRVSDLRGLSTVTATCTDGRQRALVGGNAPGGARPLSFSGATPDAQWAKVGDSAGEIRVLDWSEGEVGALYERAAREASAGAAGVVVRIDAATWERLRPWLDFPSDLTAASQAELNKPGRNGKPRPRPVMNAWICGRRARAGDRGFEALTIPVVAVPPHWPAAEKEARPLTLKDLDRVKLQSGVVEGVRTNGQNLVFHVPATNAPESKRPAVVLFMAHYDALGVDGRRQFLGADDNASGMSTIALAAMAAGSPAGRVGALFAFTDAEEWGLLGSRALVDQLADKYDVRAVVNVDSVGRAVSQPTYVVGLTKHPKLAAAVQARLDAQGLMRGSNIDKYAYAHGSDHWPFHEAGIPAILIWASDYAVMNTVADTPDKVEAAGVARIAAALKALIQAGLDDL